MAFVTFGLLRLSRFAGAQLTDTDGEQSWIYSDPDINQTGTAAYNGIKVDVTYLKNIIGRSSDLNKSRAESIKKDFLENGLEW